MNIIFGESAAVVPDHYIKLELDTVQVQGKAITAYCLVEHVPLSEFPSVENNKQVHSMLMENYRKRNWDYCTTVLESLVGLWNGELDSFYAELQKRIEKFKITPPPADWNGVYDQ
jgi:adenylate cyclase